MLSLNMLVLGELTSGCHHPMLFRLGDQNRSDESTYARSGLSC